MPLDNAPLTTQEDEVSLHDSYANSLGVALEESTDGFATDNAGTASPAGDKAAPSVDTETAEQQADRLRDEKGRFAPGKVDAAEVKAPVAPVVDPLDKQAEPPSTWNTQEKIAFRGAPPEVQQAILRREANYAHGVSTYKQEFDRVKPLADAIEPLLPVLQQFGREPGEWIRTMGMVHQTFAMGSPQQKLQATLKLLQDYNVPLGEYLTQGGQLPQFNPNATQPQPVAQPQQDVRAIVQEQLQMHQMGQTVKQFTEAKDAQGNPRYPHYETVKQDMIGLLQAGLAVDLESAYDKSIRMHDDLWQQSQEAKAQSAAADKLAQSQQAVARAKRNAVSVTNSTRSANMSSGGDKDLGDMYAEALGAGTGRV